MVVAKKDVVVTFPVVTMVTIEGGKSRFQQTVTMVPAKLPRWVLKYIDLVQGNLIKRAAKSSKS